MAEISAAAVKSLRERTGLPLMECKRALEKAGGNEEKAIEDLRKEGAKTMQQRSGRETSSGRIAVYTDRAKGVGAMVELQCESDPVAKNDEFRQLASDLAQQLATGPGAATPEELLKQTSPSKKGQTLQQQLDDLTNKIREVFKLARIVRIDAACGSYAHHTGMSAVLMEICGGNDEAAKEVCMHVAAMKPSVVKKEDLDPALVEKEREILSEAARKEGKPDNIIAKMVEGRLKNFYAERVLSEQPFVKDDKITVGKFAKDNGLTLGRFVRWELGKA
jgi:elongation factor Ts